MISMKRRLKRLRRSAGELGIEMMVLDDGWFGKRDDDNSGLGDWFVNEEKDSRTVCQSLQRRSMKRV